MRALLLDDLWVQRPGRPAPRALLQGVSLHLEQGEVLGLIGPSGAGKTLTAAALCGLLPPPLAAVRGRLRLGERELPLDRPESWADQRGRRVLMLFQEAGAALDPLMKVEKQVAQALRAVRGTSRSQALEQTREALARFGLSNAAGRHRPHQLSGGMRRRVMLALAWALAPGVLIADEPTVGLDPANQAEMLAMFAELAAEKGTSLLLITHDLRAALGIASRLAVMDHGRVVEQGPARRLMEHPRHSLTRDLADALNFLEGNRA